jgi:hypothetical protein
MDADFRVVDFDLVDERSDISAPDCKLAAQDVRLHQLGEGGDVVLSSASIWPHLRNRAVKRDLHDATFVNEAQH